MLLEIHAHTTEHSACSHISAVDLVREVYSRGLDGLVITDHHYLWSQEEIQSLRSAAAVPDHFLIIAAQEVATSDMGDVLVYGGRKSIPKGRRLAEIRAEHPHAALVWAHPFRRGKNPHPQKLLHPLLDGVEVLSSNHSPLENLRGLRAWQKHRFTATAGTDIHAGSYARSCPTLFDRWVKDTDALAEEVKRGRCRPLFEETSKEGTTDVKVSEITIGSNGGGAPGFRIIVKHVPNQDDWEAVGRAFRIMEALTRNGFDRGVYRVPRPLQADAESRVVIEEDLNGRSLFEALIGASVVEARHITQLAARWLARLHNSRIVIDSPEGFLEEEAKHLDRYVQRFELVRHSYTERIRKMVETVRRAEITQFEGRSDLLHPGHSDYHPRNIYVCMDAKNDRMVSHIAAIDFAGSRYLPPAFDVGAFLAQFRNQIITTYPAILDNVPGEVFLDAYLQDSAVAGSDFLRHVQLFLVRASLSIAAFEVKMGHGESENLQRVVTEAEEALERFAS